MNTLRALLGIIGGCAAGYAIASLIPFTHMTDRDFAAGLAISAACVLLIGLVRAVQADQARDRAHRRAYRDAVWQRRAYEARRQTTYQEKKAS